MTSNDPQTAPAAAAPAPAAPEAPKERPGAIYCSATIGALFLGLSDILKNGNAATVNKLGEVMRHLLLDNGYAPLLSLLALVLLGAMICFVHQPPTRVDGFARGFSVFAILAVATPGSDLPPPTAEPVDVLSGEQTESEEAPAGGQIGGARYDSRAPGEGFRLTGSAPATGYRLAGDPDVCDAMEARLRKAWEGRPRNHGLAAVRLLGAGGKSPPQAVVKVRDAGSARIVGQSTTRDGTALVLKPRARYVVEVEAAGYRRVRFDLVLGDKVTGYDVRLEPSSVPLNLQRLVAAEEVEPTTCRFAPANRRASRPGLES